MSFRLVRVWCERGISLTVTKEGSFGLESLNIRVDTFLSFI
jgi:hypothetical protein